MSSDMLGGKILPDLRALPVIRSLKYESYLVRCSWAGRAYLLSSLRGLVVGMVIL